MASVLEVNSGNQYRRVIRQNTKTPFLFKFKKRGNKFLLKNEGSDLNVCSNWTLHVRVG